SRGVDGRSAQAARRAQTAGGSDRGRVRLAEGQDPRRLIASENARDGLRGSGARTGFRSAGTGKPKGVQILELIIIGIVVGVIARLIMPGRQHIGVLMTVLLGIGGAIVGGVVASAIGTGDIFELNVIGTIVGIVAAVGLIAIAEALGVGQDRTRSA